MEVGEIPYIMYTFSLLTRSGCSWCTEMPFMISLTKVDNVYLYFSVCKLIFQIIIINSLYLSNLLTE